VAPAGAQVILDGSLGTAGPVSCDGEPSDCTYWITEDLGRTSGVNLFHSFGQFDIGNEATASFDGSAIIENIIARITGGRRSTIDGRIQSQIAGASLFLLNPWGFMFKENAQLDLTGSGYFSTASRLRFPDEGGQAVYFDAREDTDPGFLSAEDPIAFGFLQEIDGQPAPAESIDLRLSAGFGKDGEFIGSGGTLGFVAGSVTITSTKASDLEQTIRTGETVAIAAAGTAVTEVPVDIASFDVAAVEGKLGLVRIRDDALIILSRLAPPDPDNPGFSTGQLVVRAGRFELGSAVANDETQIFACQSTGDCLTGGDPLEAARDYVVDVAVAGDGDLNSPDVLIEGAEDGDRRIFIRTRGDPVGDVRLVGPNVTVRGAPGVGTGEIEIELWSLIDDYAGPSLEVVAEEIQIVDGGGIRTFAAGGSTKTGRGGDLRLTANEIHVGREGLVYSRTASTGQGGTIDIDTGNLTVDGGSYDAVAGEVVDAGLIASENDDPGPGGHIEIHASGEVHVTEFGAILSGIDSGTADEATAPGGNVRIAADTIRVESADSPVTRSSSQISAITRATSADGRGGDVILSAREVLLQNGGQIITSTGALENGSVVGGTADGGDIHISARVDRGEDPSRLPAELVSIDGTADFAGSAIPAGLFARTRGGGDAGSIRVASRVVEVRAGGVISAAALEDGAMGSAGNIILEQAERVTLTSESAAGFAASDPLISVDAQNGSETGNVVIEADRLELLAGGAVVADTRGTAPAGSILVDAREVLIEGSFEGNFSGLASQSIEGRSENGNAGDITLRIGESLIVRDGAEIAVEALGTPFAGDINIEGSNAQVVISDQAKITGKVGGPEPGEGPSADIVIAVDRLQLDSGAEINAETDGAYQGGIVDISTRRGVSLSGGARISSLSETTGAAGNIQIAALDLAVDSGASISAEAQGSGDGGLVDIAVRRQARLSNGGRVTSSSRAGGNAGSVEFRAANLLIDGGGLPADSASAIAAESEGRGAGGDVTVTTSGSTTLQRGGRISSSSTSTEPDAGDAGNVVVDGGRELVLRGGSAITTDTFRSAEQAEGAAGGQITLIASELIYLEDSEVSTSVFEGGGGGGDIGIPVLPPPPDDGPIAEADGDSPPPPELLVLNRSAIRANAQQGDGGAIEISAGTIFRSAGSVIEAVSQRGGVDGTVNIDAPDSDLAGQVTPLTTRFFDASELMLPACAARTSRAGSFTIQTRAVQPPPDAPLPASLATSADPTRGAACSS
jgi:filamentous hemagglutinin family protein